MIGADSRRHFFAAAVLGMALAAGWLAYAPALGGDFLLDDLANLDGLEDVHDVDSAVRFVLSGTAGPLGRPLALLSFVLQPGTGELEASSFLAFNILIHLFNGALLAGFFYGLSRLSGLRTGQSLFVAVSAATLWLFMPLLASASLMIIQRMTTLSATFVLLGLCAYVYARSHADRTPGTALAFMALSVAGGTLLAMLTKESGIALPMLVLVAEATILTRPARMPSRHWRLFVSVFLVLPTACIVGYLLTRIPYDPDVVMRRDFSAWERLLTESRVLWNYLYNAFVPAPGSFGPFHDNYPVARTLLNPLTFCAFFAWIATLAAAITWRRRFPVAAFAVLWFFAAHLLESTVLPLELYFEHRNYIPIIGPVFALCALAIQVPQKRLVVVYAAIPLYVCVNAFALTGLTGLWGDPLLATHYWQRAFPGSVRAATAASRHQLENDRPDRTLQTLQTLVDENPGAGYMKIQSLVLSCVLAPGDDHGNEVRDIRRLLRDVDFTHSVATSLSTLFSNVRRFDCNGVDIEAVKSLANAVLANPRYASSKLYNHLHHQLLAEIARYEGDPSLAIRHIRKAMAHLHTAELNSMLVVTYVESRQFPEARDFVATARHNAPLHPLQRHVWHNDLDNLDLYIDEMENRQTNSPASPLNTETQTR